MMIISAIERMQYFSKIAKQAKKRIGFVPTMGALHIGHLSLIRQARKENDLTIVSIFVNPLQFGAKEDFKKYPRNPEQDADICRKEGVDVIFSPQVKRMYPEGNKTSVEVRDLSSFLCGKSRPGHFKGVATVVTKLFNIVDADIAYFGQKDAQQALIIKRIVDDLNISIKIRVMPTIRDKAGLALSSRNAYLKDKERKDAAVIYQSLLLARDMARSGERSSDKIIQQMKKMILQKKSIRIDYVALVDKDTLEPMNKVSKRAMVALAVWAGRTRLIDNILLKLKAA